MYLDGDSIARRRSNSLSAIRRVARPREQSLAFTDRYRSYVINYSSGEDLIRAYVERSGDTAGAMAAYKRIMSELMLPADLARKGRGVAPRPWTYARNPQFGFCTKRRNSDHGTERPCSGAMVCTSSL